MIGVFSLGMLRNGELPILASSEIVSINANSKLDAVAGWGCKPNVKRVEAYAKKNHLPLLRMEDGFLRSYAAGSHYPQLSLIIDHVGIYYDATKPSDLENLLNTDHNVLIGIEPDVIRAKALILQHHLSKYNHAPELNNADLRTGDSERVLVIDQTKGDMSVVLGGADQTTFLSMLEAAKQENPHATIYVKTHPEVSAGTKSGYLTHIQNDERVVVLRNAVNPISLIEKMDKVYVVTSTMGFEALLVGKKVSIFGLPWYAGWGVTDDRQTITRRTQQRSVDELFAAAYFHYTKYLNPTNHQLGTIFDVINWLVLQRDMANKWSGRKICVGYRRWKAANLQPLLSLNNQEVVFVKNADQVKKLSITKSDSLVYWGREAPEGVAALTKQYQIPLYRMEDGFVRSVGLGSDLIPPLSLVLDDQGIYFDPTQPSRLENILNTAIFSKDDLDRAENVRQLITQHGVTKYNLEPRQKPEWQTEGRYVILVPGQVEDDASIRFGCTDVKTNLGLLKAVRESYPHAFIVYKPHPDVMSGNRKGNVALEQAKQYADHIETKISVVSCIDACDAVHTMTSLTGFDALLRLKEVTTYGQPFYAGWGLTKDKVKNGIAFKRRKKQLSLLQLVAGALIAYPLYFDPKLKGYTTCEAVVQQLISYRDELEQTGKLQQLNVGYLKRQSRKIAILLKAFFKILRKSKLLE